MIECKLQSYFFESIALERDESYDLMQLYHVVFISILVQTLSENSCNLL